VKPKPGGVTYRHWLGLVENATYPAKSGKERHEPARVVRQMLHLASRLAHEELRLWSFGYEMDRKKIMKARCWYESEMPLLSVPLAHRRAFRQSINDAIVAATVVVNALRLALFRTRFGRPAEKVLARSRRIIDWEYPKEHRATAKDYGRAAEQPTSVNEDKAATKDKGIIESTGSAFWQTTEAAFYDFLASLKSRLEAGDIREAAHPAWYKAIQATAIRLFDETVESADLEGNLKARVFARQGLLTTLDSNQLKNDILRLSVISGAKP
jgi:CRISPR system Cascade subunit CasA